MHLALLPGADELTMGITREQRTRLENWDRLMPVRELVLKSLESARQEKSIGAPLEARVRLLANRDLFPLLTEYGRELPGLFIVSQVAVENGSGEELSIAVERAEGQKCERCWKYLPDVGRDQDFPTVCGNCRQALREMLGE